MIWTFQDLQNLPEIYWFWHFMTCRIYQKFTGWFDISQPAEFTRNLLVNLTFHDPTRRIYWKFTGLSLYNNIWNPWITEEYFLKLCTRILLGLKQIKIRNPLLLTLLNSVIQTTQTISSLFFLIPTSGDHSTKAGKWW